MNYNIIISFIFCLSLAACHQHSEDEHNHDTTNKEEHPEEENVTILDSFQRAKIGVSVGTFTKINMNATLKVAGHLIANPSDKAIASSLTAGIIKQILIKHGQQVSKGQILFTIQSPALIDLQKSYLQTYNALQVAENEFNRQKNLIQDSATSFKNFEMAQLEYNNLSRNLILQQSELAIYSLNPTQIIAGQLQTVYQIISPISGQVQEVSNNIGQQVSSYSPLLTIINNKHIEADLLVFESDAQQVKVGQKVYFEYQNQAYEAQIVAVNQELEQKDRSLRVHAEIIGNQQQLIAGAYIEGRIELQRQDTDCLPIDALANNNGLSYIFTEELHENRFEYTAIPVLLGNKNSQWIEIQPTVSLPANSKIVTKAAFYIMAQSQKSSAAHEH